MASPKALQAWCRSTCAHYPNVEIKNMSTSFRDGLAFCAIIHKHRPDLIDFSSLSKVNVYQNNKLAFEVAQMKLGIPALLDPNDMVSTKVPDSLSVITYLSEYYFFFNRKSYAGLTSLRSPHVSVLNKLTQSKTPDGEKPHKGSTDLETGTGDCLFNRRQRTPCNLCFKPVHLIQRHLIDGKVYHRSCFRCTVCHSTLLPRSYTQGSDAGSLICTHHTTDGKSVHPHLTQQIGSTENQPKCAFQAGYFSLSGLVVSSVPHYTKKTESEDRLVCKTADMEGKEMQERSRGSEDSKKRDCTVGLKTTVKKSATPCVPPPSVKDRTVEGAAKAGPAPVLEGGRPVPAPRRMSGSAVGPVPTPRTKSSQTTISSPAAGNSSSPNKCSPISPHVTSPTSGSPKVKTNHPWLTIIHPGPWTQLPLAPAPVPRSTSVSNLGRSWYRPKVPAPNPFEEDVDEDSQATTHSGNEGDLRPVADTKGPAGDTSQIGISHLDETGTTGSSPADATEGAAAAADHVTSAETQSHILPRSLSGPAAISAHCQSSFLPAETTEENKCEQVTSCHTKLSCRENPFDRKPAMTKSNTCQSFASRQAPAPGHGFPLIKRKVQTDHNISTEDLQVEMRELYKHLEVIEHRGVKLERNLRDCTNDKEEEQMLMEWFSLIHERHILVRRDTELVYLTTQQKLEERHADVEYELRCILNKPERDWNQEDRRRERQLTDELLVIIEQRNQIISSLDQDMQREREEDVFLKTVMTNKDFQKEGLKELKKSKGKFKITKVFKMRNHKAETPKDTMDKKS